jgi:hypothetical protein
MKNAKAVITFAMGGNFWMSKSVATTIGYRQDNSFPETPLNDMVCHPSYHVGDFVTQNWSEFTDKVKSL